MTWPELVSSLGRCDEEQAFIYYAEVGTRIERSAFALNPGLSSLALADVLADPPSWLKDRSELLAHAWPEIQPHAAPDLLPAALLSCKAMLGLGAIVRDGSFRDMKQQFVELFPELAGSEQDSEKFRSTSFQVAIRATGSHQTWFQCTGSREGCALPLDEPIRRPVHGWTRWEIAMKNLLRLDLQKHIEHLLESREPMER